MDESPDSGDIVIQRQLEIGPGDTADTLYSRLLDLELEVFEEAWPLLVEGSYQREPQQQGAGTFHARGDLDTSDVQQIDPNEEVLADDLLCKLRALTTNRIDEAAYYEIGSTRYRVRLEVTEEVIESREDSS